MSWAKPYEQMIQKALKTDSPLAKASMALTSFVMAGLLKYVEPIRLARAASSLIFCGSSPSLPLFAQTIARLKSCRHNDGAWSDPEETAWAVRMMSSAIGLSGPLIDSAVQWLHAVRKISGGWGRHTRDQARIPTTGLISALVPNVIKPDDISWLANEWQHDFEGPVQLSYKAGFFLLAVPEGYADALTEQTIEHLSKDQNEDGGFGPWRNHPIGSDPWSTGVALWGLSRWITMVDKSVIHKALAWLERTQLPSGYWPYHYLDDGTSLALIGAVAAMKALASTE
jgi:hypothetical protein